ncbi:DUF4113 domain-containing protein [Acidovorax sp. SDU_ACID1]
MSGGSHADATSGSAKCWDWEMRQERRTPQYTTRGEDVSIAGA